MLYGAIPSPPDDRDYSIASFTSVKSIFPDEFMIMPKEEISVYDQGDTSMCVAFSLAEIKEMQEVKDQGEKIVFSPGFIYGNRNSQDYNGEGMVLRNALKHLQDEGVVLYKDFPFIGAYSDCYRILQQVIKLLLPKAEPYKILNYVRLWNSNEVKTALMELGPVLLSCKITESFLLTGKDGKVPPYAGDYLGNHAMVIVGWNKDGWVVLNSYGNWGDNGFLYIPFDYPGISELWSLTDMERKVLSVEEGIVMKINQKEYTINGEKKEMDVAPKIENGRTLVPIRFVAQALGKQVIWQPPDTIIIK